MGFLCNLRIVDHHTVPGHPPDICLGDTGSCFFQLREHGHLFQHIRELLCLFRGHVPALGSRVGDHLMLLVQGLNRLQSLRWRQPQHLSRIPLQSRQVIEFRRTGIRRLLFDFPDGAFLWHLYRQCLLPVFVGNGLPGLHDLHPGKSRIGCRQVVVGLWHEPLNGHGIVIHQFQCRGLHPSHCHQFPGAKRHEPGAVHAVQPVCMAS